MTERYDPNSRIENPLSIEALISGTVYSFNKNFDGDDEVNAMFDELNIGSDDDSDDSESDEIPYVKTSPGLQKFSDLKKEMEPINEYVSKKILNAGFKRQKKVAENSRVKLLYAGYLEGEEKAFDKKSRLYDMCQHDILPGLEMAIQSMHEGETAQFWLSYEVVLGEMGCPPRVKPRSDAIFVIKLCSIEEIKDDEAGEASLQEPKTKFTQLIEGVREQHKNGILYFNQCIYNLCIKEFNKAVETLSYCGLADEKEEAEQKSLLIRLYTDLAVVYNKTKRPKRTCIACNQLKHLTQGKPPIKALFHEGRALIMLNDYERAQSVLAKAMTLEPNNEAIKKELSIARERLEYQKRNYAEMCRRALGNQQKSDEPTVTTKDLKEFREHLITTLDEFQSDESETKLDLTGGLSKEQIHVIEGLVKERGMHLTNDSNVYIVLKKNT